ncbi:hypothetical protein DFR52_101483 [Hoeflea marina]|uniref:Uncharacterized protein n=1 Tax=Hoeflea marina TaxID=274592 RepID=A0A317PSR6_9HYPH|nr:hypothetical protein [Hoeflea marina]PWW03795.1 hypothetical protein DFR52_101483 [Hoeflea marina]
MREVWCALRHGKSLIVPGLLGLYVAGIVWCRGASRPVGVGSTHDPGFFGKWITDDLKFFVVVEFLVNFYTVHLAVELLMLPFLTLVFMMPAVNESSEKYAPVTKILNAVIVIIGLVILAYTLAMVVADFSNFASLSTLRDLYTLVLQSLLSTRRVSIHPGTRKRAPPRHHSLRQHLGNREAGQAGGGE